MKVRFLLFILFAALVTSATSAQTRKQLENKRKQLQKEIIKAQSLLSQSKEEEEALLSQLGDLNQKIEIRSKLISTIYSEAEKLGEEIERNEKQITALEQNLTVLKKEYAAMIIKSYKSKSKQSRLMFLLSSENFAQAYKRLQYIKQYTSYRKSQGEEIKAASAELIAMTDSLRNREDEKQLLIALNLKERQNVELEKSSQERLVSKVKAKEQKYIGEIRRIQAEDRKLDKKIQRLIAEAIAKNNKKSGSTASGFILDTEGKKLTSNFVANKGKLPWPTEKGIVVRKYGKQKHPTLAGITIQSNGVHLATEKRAMARSVFNGKVLSIQLQPGRKKMVLVQHGNYISAYKNLDQVMVKKGQSISTKQEIGTIHTDAVTGKTILAFSLFKETKIQNPQQWVDNML